MLGLHAAITTWRVYRHRETTSVLVSNLRVLESRVAAAYAKLALLENSRRLARFRELRQRNECLSSSTSRTRPAFEPSSDPLAVSEVQDSTVSLRFVPLPGDVMTTSSNITSFLKIKSLYHLSGQHMFNLVFFRHYKILHNLEPCTPRANDE